MATKNYFTQSEIDKINATRDKMGEEAFTRYVNTHDRKDEFLSVLSNTYQSPTGTTSARSIIDSSPKTTVKATADSPIVQRGTVDTSNNTTYTSGSKTSTPETTNYLDQIKGTTSKTSTESQPENITQELQDLYDKYGQDNIVYDANGNVDLRETMLDQVMTNEEKNQVYDYVVQDIKRRRRENLITFDEANAEMRQAREDYKSGALFGGATMTKMYDDRITYEMNEVEKAKQEALKTAEDVFEEDLKRKEQQIREAGQRVMDTTQRLNSLRGAGRSSYNEAIIMEQQDEINSLIATAQAKTANALAIRKAEINGASAEAMEALINQRAAINNALSQKLSNAMDRQKALNEEIATNFADGLQNIMDVLESGNVDTSQIDFETTLRRGGDFLINKDGSLWINPNTGRPEFLKKEAGRDPKFREVKDGNGNTLLYKDFDLHTVITNDGQMITGEALNNLSLPKTSAEAELGDWKKLDDETLYNEKTGEFRFKEGGINIDQANSYMTDEEAELVEVTMPDGSTIMAAQGLINGLEDIMNENPNLQFDMQNLYRTKDDQKALYGKGRTVEELIDAGLTPEEAELYADPDANEVTWSLTSSHMNGNAIDLVVPEGEDKVEYTARIEPIMNARGFYRPDSTVAMGDYGHFEYKGLAPQLSAQDLFQAAKISTDVFGKRAGTKPENIKKVEDLMKQGMSVDDIENLLREGGFATVFEGGVYESAFDNVATHGKFSAAIKGENREVLEKKLETYGPESQQVRDYMSSLVYASLDIDSKKKLKGYEALEKMVVDIRDDLKQFVDKGGKTNIFEGTQEKMLKKVGNVKDPELRKIANKIAKTIQTYRQGVSGAAFSESESAEYKAIFPSIDNVEELNMALIDGLLESNALAIDTVYGQVMGTTEYPMIFPRAEVNDIRARINMGSSDIASNLGSIATGIGASIGLGNQYTVENLEDIWNTDSFDNVATNTNTFSLEEEELLNEY